MTKKKKSVIAWARNGERKDCNRIMTIFCGVTEMFSILIIIKTFMDICKYQS